MPHALVKPEICYRCKTFKKLCGLPVCPVRERLRVIVHTYSKISFTSSVNGATPPSGIVGEWGYPKVNVLVNMPPGEKGEYAKMYDNPLAWWTSKLSLEDIVKLRSHMVSVICGRFPVSEYEKLLEREISLTQVATKPVDTEVKVEKIVNKRLLFDLRLLPLSIQVQGNIKVTSNPSIPRQLEKLVYDDLKAREAVVYLYCSGVDIYTIQRAFSFGLLGERRHRKLVPTRWAITAVDRILTDYLRRKVHRCRIIDKFYVYQISYLGNRFTVILIPDALRITWIEFWYSRSGLSDRPIVSTIIEEDLRGNVETMDGGFEAGRMGLLEALLKMNTQARAIIVREILPEYYIGIGNWHIREDLRRLGEIKPLLRTDNPDEVISAIDSIMHPDAAAVLRRHFKRVLSQTKIV